MVALPLIDTPTTPADAAPEPLSKTELVYRHVRRRIVSLELPPGTTIDKPELCAELGVSRLPVSEALSRLAHEGLVVVEPQRGSFVTKLDRKAIAAASFIRRALEAETCRVVAMNPSPALVSDLKANLARQRELVAGQDVDAFYEFDRLFHQRIQQALDLPGVGEIGSLTFANLERVRRLTLPLPQRLTEVYHEHVAIVDAIAARDPHAAAGAMRDHIARLVTSVDNLAAARPELFAGA